jgi:hypothetical protein
VNREGRGGEGRGEGRGAVYPCDEFGHIGRTDNEQLGQNRGQNSIHGRKHVHLRVLNKRGKVKTLGQSKANQEERGDDWLCYLDQQSVG